MLDAAALIFLAVVLPMLINKSTERGYFDWVVPYLREAWTVVFGIFCLYLLFKEPAFTFTMFLHRQQHIPPLVIYLGVGIIGALLLCSYYWLAGKLFSHETLQKLSVEEKLQRWLAQRTSWTTERLPDEPDLNFIYRVINDDKEVVLISKKKDQSIIAIHTRFFSPPSVIRVIDSLSADQQLELSNEIRKTMTDAHITHFAIAQQPFREFVFAEHIQVDSLTEDDLMAKIMRVYKSLYLLTETLTVTVKRLIKAEGQ